MANDCLVTKLKGVVSNDALAKLGEVSFVIKTAKNVRVSVAGTESSYSARIVGDGYFSDSTYTENRGKTATLTSTVMNYAVCSSNCTIFINDVNYAITQFNCDGLYANGSQIIAHQLSSLIVNLDEGITEDGSLSTVGTLTIRDGIIDLKALNGNSSLTSLNLNGNTKATGDILYLANCAIGGVVNFNNAKNVYGQIANLGKCTAATNIPMYGSGISGTFESLVEALYNGGNGKTSGTLTLGGNGIVTFHNTIIANERGGNAVFTSEGATVTFGSVVGTYNGSTWSYNS